MPTASPDTPHSLLERTRNPGDAVAWDRFSRLYAPLLSAWYRAAGVQPADADDLVQKTFQLLLRKLPEFDHSGRPGAFRSWLRNVVFNLLRDFRRTRPHIGTDGMADPIDGQADSVQKWDREHDLHVLNGLLELVRPDFSTGVWRAFCLTALEGRSADEAAAATGLSANAVTISRSRVLGRLRREAQGLID